VLIHYVLEDELVHSMLEAGGDGRDVFDEQDQFLLVLFGLLSVLQEANDLTGDIGSQFDVLHGGVHLVQFLLKGIGLLVQVLNDDGHAAEDVRVYNGSEGVRQYHEEHLELNLRKGIVARHEKDRVVDGDEVFPYDLVIEQVFVRGPNDERRDPGLVLVVVHNGEPSAARAVDVQDDEENKLE